MKRLKKELQAVSKELKALVNKTEKLMKAFDKLEKAPAAEKKKTKVRAKKAAAQTATEQVVSLVKRSKKGVDIPTLVEKTGFEDKKIRNIVFRALKQGKIERAGRGVYAGT